MLWPIVSAPKFEFCIGGLSENLISHCHCGVLRHECDTKDEHERYFSGSVFHGSFAASNLSDREHVRRRTRYQVACLRGVRGERAPRAHEGLAHQVRVKNMLE